MILSKEGKFAKHIAMQIAQEVGTLENYGETAMCLETINALVLLAMFKGDTRKAAGMADALHDGTVKRIMVAEGKPRI